MANNNTILNKSMTSCIFSNYGELLIRPQDLSDSMISISLGGDGVNRIPGALGTIRSVNFYTQAEVVISLLKTSNLASVFLDQYKARAVLDGTCIINTDSGMVFKLSNLSFELSGADSSGSDATLVMSLRGDYHINSALLA